MIKENEILESVLRFGRKIIPKPVFKFFQPFYHFLLSYAGALIYGFPSRKLIVVGVTGTKGKTTTCDLIAQILNGAGFKTGLITTVTLRIGEKEWRNESKQTMLGRFRLQKFLRQMVREKCQYAVIEISSEGILQYRHRFIDYSVAIFTNLSPEHIERHGSFEKYREAKLKLFEALQNSSKPKRISIVNADDGNAEYFLKFKVDEQQLYGLKEVSGYKVDESGINFEIDGVGFHSPLLGEFNLYNILAAFAFARSQTISDEIIRRALAKFSGVPGRVEFIDEGQDFKVVVDYAHTPESLEKLYQLFQNSRKICVLGSAGGGRDKWKREKMGRIASAYCNEIILTNEDPYDEDPEKIVKDIAGGLVGFSGFKIIIDRREAIAEALKNAKSGDAVIITGKGTDPFIMGPGGTKIKWDDREVCREELKNFLKNR